MTTRIEIVDELMAISPLLAGIEKRNVFSIPDGYFSKFEDDILERAETSLINSIPKTPFQVPGNYFDQLAFNILDAIRMNRQSADEELKEVSPILYAIQAENPFSKPIDYFDELPSEILAKVKPTARVVRLQKRSSVWQFARAAVVTGVIAASALMVYNNQETFENMSVSADIKEAQKYKNEQQVNEGISKLSDEEIIKYLENTGNASDNETLNNTIDESDLQDQKDQLNNEKVLDKVPDTAPVSKSVN